MEDYMRFIENYSDKLDFKDGVSDYNRSFVVKILRDFYIALKELEADDGK